MTDVSMKVISARLPEGAIQKIDEIVMKLRGETPLITISRTDVVRMLILLGIAAFENTSTAE